MSRQSLISSLFLLFMAYSGWAQSIAEVQKNDTTPTEKSNYLSEKVLQKRLVNHPRITEEFTTNGTIVLKVCVDNNGNVLKANLIRERSIDYTEALIRIARDNAFNYKFSKSELKEQCGTISYVFKLKEEDEKEKD